MSEATFEAAASQAWTRTCLCPRRAAMGLDALPTALLDFVVKVAGYEHGWRLEVASPALREASAVCVSRQLGACWWTEERPERGKCRTAVFQPRWRHCAAAKRCSRTAAPRLERATPPLPPTLHDIALLPCTPRTERRREEAVTRS